MGLYNRWFGRHRRTGETVGGSYTSDDVLDRIRRNLLDSHHLYIGVNPSTKPAGVRCADKDIPIIRGILIDIDNHTRDNGHEVSLGQIYSKISTAIQITLDYLPSISMFDTGRGFHFIIEVPDYSVQDRQSRSIFRHAVSTFLTTLCRQFGRRTEYHIDPCTSDLARLRRMPHSINHSNGRIAIPLGRQISVPLDITHFLSKFSESRPPIVHQSTEWWKVFSHPAMAVTARRFISEGVLEGQRNSNAHATAKALHEFGVSFSSAREALLKGAMLCKPRLTPREALNALKSAYKEDK